MTTSINCVELTIDKRHSEWIKYGKLLIFACYFVYVAELAAKFVFGAEIATIIVELKTDKVNASFANTYYFIVYGLVQVILSFLMGKIDMRKYLVVTLPFAAITMICMGFATNIEFMWIIFPISGIFQAGLWSGINLILTKYLPACLLNTANRVINTGVAVSSIIAYGMSAVCVSYVGWRMPFFILGTVFLISAVFFAFVVRKTQNYADILDDTTLFNGDKDIDNNSLFTLNTRKQTVAFYCISIVMVFLITSVYNSLCNWLPSLLIDVFSFRQDVSIYVSILSPVVMLFGPMLTLWSCARDKNFIRQCLIYSSIILLICILLTFLYQTNVILAVLLFVLYMGLANGIRVIVLSVITFQLHTQINAGTYSAISNAVASVSSGVIPTFFGFLIDSYGWKNAFSFTIILLGVIIVLLFVLMILVNLMNNRK